MRSLKRSEELLSGGPPGTQLRGGVSRADWKWRRLTCLHRSLGGGGRHLPGHTHLGPEGTLGLAGGPAPSWCSPCPRARRSHSRASDVCGCHLGDASRSPGSGGQGSLQTQSPGTVTVGATQKGRTPLYLVWLRGPLGFMLMCRKFLNSYQPHHRTARGSRSRSAFFKAY